MTMPSILTFEETPRLNDEYPVPALRVHSAVGCGRTFSDVAAVLEHEGPNPAIWLPVPLGTDLVRKIVDEINRRRGLRGQMPIVG